MKTEHTLRYLLLRHLKMLERTVPRDRYQEITASLTVEVIGRTAYCVRYRDQGSECEETLPFDEFRFYERGDTRALERGVDDSLRNRNDELAHRFAEQVLGVGSDALTAPPTEPLEVHRGAAAIELGIFALLTVWAAGLELPAAVALVALVVAEFARPGRLLCSALLPVVALTGPPTAALLLASAYGLLQLLDPNPERRLLRVALCGVAVALAVRGIVFASGSVDGSLLSVLAFVVALGLSALRSLWSSHFRALSLALPFYCAGLALDGRLGAAAIGLAVLSLGALFAASGYRWRPVQKARVEGLDRG